MGNMPTEERVRLREHVAAGKPLLFGPDELSYIAALLDAADERDRLETALEDAAKWLQDYVAPPGCRVGEFVTPTQRKRAFDRAKAVLAKKGTTVDQRTSTSAHNPEVAG